MISHPLGDHLPGDQDNDYYHVTQDNDDEDSDNQNNYNQDVEYGDEY